MTEEDLLSVKYAVNIACVFVCVRSHARSSLELQLTCQSECVVVLMSYCILMDGRAILGGGQNVTRMSCTYTPKCSNCSLTCTHARTCTEDISNHSVTPSQIKTNGFIWFSRRLLFGSLLYEAEMYIVSEASVRRAAGGACQSEAHSFSLDWWLAPGSQPSRGDRSNKFITKQQSVY